ncbi:hypothetical protein SAMD00023353_4001270 [Rosellinia necatrix]|uniref:Uncharacterized protein n=1 Tax=Rosellinia necatrix TaxID=77044 RepID=A0A1W2TMD1_ROSNE|nr:hypothetical protein SAMD00023353_4001270 [Rosellinia necatrix]
MSSITFNKNYIITKATASVVSIDLGFDGAVNLLNNQTTTSAVSGDSTTAVATYKNNNPPPKTFSVSQEVKFPSGAHVTLTGGGPNDNVIEAADAVGNRAVWIVVGSA